MTGMSGSGKTTISRAVSKKLKAKGFLLELIDVDEYRNNITKELGFSKKDRLENIRRLGFIGRILSRNNVIAILAVINPYKEARDYLSNMNAKTVYVKCDLEELIRRDPKGLYAKAMLADDDPKKLNNFTGISDPFEEPSSPDLILDTKKEDIEESVNILYNFILNNL